MPLERLVTPARQLAHLVHDVDFRNERDPRFVVGAYGAKGAHVLYFRPGDNQRQARIVKPSKRFPVAKPGRAPWAICHAGDGVVHLIASASEEVQAYCYHLDHDRLEETPFTIAYNREADSGSKFKHFYAFRLQLSPFDGLLYGGGYPDCRLFSWNRATGAFRDLGRIDEDENYLMWPCPSFENKIYCGLGAHAKLVECDLRTGEKHVLVPTGYLQKEFIVQLTRWRDKLVGMLIPPPVLFVYDPAARQLERLIELPGEEDFYRSDQRNLIILGNEVYFGCLISDNLYRANLTTGRLEKIASDVGGPFGLTEDRYLWCHGAIDQLTQFDLNTSRVVARYPCRFDGDGMSIFTMNFGPNGKTLYGGSFITQSFFKFDPAKNESHEFGQALNLPGQVNSLQAWQNKIFIGHYIHATVSVYDTNQPWQPFVPQGPNPRRLFSLLHEGQDRIWDMKLASDGCIYLACGASYGKLSGALVRFDPRSETYKVFHEVIPGQTLWCLETGTPGKVIIGSWIYGGLGQKPATSEGRLGIFDIASAQLEKVLVPIPQARNVTALALWKDALLVGVADGSLFMYDLSAGEIVLREKHPWGDTASLCASRDGMVYGLAQRAIYRFDPSRLLFEKLVDFQCDGFVDKILEDAEGNLYISSMTELYRLER